MKKITLFLILFLCGVFVVSAQSLEVFTFGDNRVVSHIDVCYVDNNHKPVKQNEWKRVKVEGCIGATKEFIIIVYEEPFSETQILTLTGEPSYNAKHNTLLFRYKYANITEGTATLNIENGFYVLMFEAERLSDGTIAIFKLHFK